MKFGESVYTIAEVGANHQGDLSLALKYIEEFARLGASAVKFQMRDLDTLFESEALGKPYDHSDSFGTTYGDHRAALEFSQADYAVLRKKCHQEGVDMMVTPFDEISLGRALELDVDVIKVASFDCGNLPMLEKLAKTDKPFVLSTGGSKEGEIDASVRVLEESGNELAILHCVSRYPAEPADMALLEISKLQAKYPEHVIGLSDHFSGILTGPLARSLGALVFEKHVTFSRSWRGTDHKFSLEPRGFKNFLRDILRCEQMMKHQIKEGLGTEPVFNKLGKVARASSSIAVGEKFSYDNVVGVIPGIRENTVDIKNVVNLLGKKAKNRYQAGEKIRADELK